MRSGGSYICLGKARLLIFSCAASVERRIRIGLGSVKSVYNIQHIIISKLRPQTSIYLAPGLASAAQTKSGNDNRH